MSEIKYQGKIDLTVDNNSHTIAYRFIEALANGSKLRVLEVGCASGYFGAAVKSKGHVVWGIEPDKTSAEIAKESLDFVFNGVVEAFINQYQEEKFDVVVFGDVLEHLAEPQSVLLACHDLLVDGGAVIASVPNVAHVSVRAMLLEGNWEYSELGILDKTHLRFFTKSSIQTLFYEAGFEVGNIEAVTLPAHAAAAACKMTVSESAISTVLSYAEDSCQLDFQYVLVGVPFDSKKGCGAQYIGRQNPIKVLGVANDIESSHAQVRMIEPLKAWANYSNGDVNFKAIMDCEEQDILWADIIIIQRHIDVSTLNLLKVIKDNDKKVIYDTDDYLLELPEHLLHHEAGLVAHRKNIHFLLPQVDCITAATSRLAEQYHHFERPTEVVPNCIVGGNLPVTSVEQWNEKEATLVIASTDKIIVDFIVPAIKTVLSNTALDIKVLVIGPPGDTFEDAGVEIKRISNLSYSEFKLLIRSIEHPIGIIPLDDSKFSSCKTAIKYFDYSMANIPVICSNVPPYSDVISHDVNGILSENSTEAWVHNITRLVENVGLRERLVQSAQNMINSQFSKYTLIRSYGLLFRKLLDGGFNIHKPAIAASGKGLFLSKLRYYIAHIFNLSSYTRVFAVFRREGFSGVIKRLKF